MIIITKEQIKTIIGTIGLTLSTGSVYAMSIFTLPLMNQYGFLAPDVAFIFSLAIFVLGMSATIFGELVEKHGPREIGLIATVLFSGGLILSGLSLTLELGALTSLYFWYSIISGAALGLSYIACPSTLLKQFPKNKAKAAAISIISFGLGAAVNAPISQLLLEIYPVNEVFIILGIGYFIIMLLSSLLLPKKPFKTEQTNYGVTAHEALGVKEFYIIWLMFFFNIFFGISLISVAAPLGTEEFMLSAIEAAGFVAAISVANTIGRFILAALSDKLGPKKTYIGIYLIQLVAITSIIFVNVISIKIIAVLIIAMCYGGGFAVLPHLVATNFGLKNIGYIHSRLLSAWAMAGIFAGLSIGFLKSIFGTYLIICPIFLIIFIITCYLAYKLKDQYK